MKRTTRTSRPDRPRRPPESGEAGEPGESTDMAHAFGPRAFRSRRPLYSAKFRKKFHARHLTSLLRRCPSFFKLRAAAGWLLPPCPCSPIQNGTGDTRALMIAAPGRHAFPGFRAPAHRTGAGFAIRQARPASAQDWTEETARPRGVLTDGCLRQWSPRPCAAWRPRSWGA
jgi:hypothetical protein